MRLHICAIGRLRAGPKRALIDDYLNRFDRTGRALSLGPCSEHEVDDRKATTPAATKGARCWNARVPDRRAGRGAGRTRRRLCHNSRAFAQMLATRRDSGCADLAFVIGGADGLEPEFRSSAQGLLSFGPMVWPHALARVMLCEQIYRAATILAGGPYHRD
jgi:23S rRNA (pseudouridine1915-N3)-methyltransferase